MELASSGRILRPSNARGRRLRPIHRSSGKSRQCVWRRQSRIATPALRYMLEANGKNWLCFARFWMRRLRRHRIDRTRAQEQITKRTQFRRQAHDYAPAICCSAEATRSCGVSLRSAKRISTFLLARYPAYRLLECNRDLNAWTLGATLSFFLGRLGGFAADYFRGNTSTLHAAGL
jgi:hypothetical protein